MENYLPNYKRQQRVVKLKHDIRSGRRKKSTQLESIFRYGRCVLNLQNLHAINMTEQNSTLLPYESIYWVPAWELLVVLFYCASTLILTVFCFCRAQVFCRLLESVFWCILLSTDRWIVFVWLFKQYSIVPTSENNRSAMIQRSENQL